MIEDSLFIGILSGMFSEQSDVYSFGIVIWEILSEGRELYPNMSNEEAALAVTSLDTRPTASAEMTTDTRLSDIMKSKQMKSLFL